MTKTPSVADRYRKRALAVTKQAKGSGSFRSRLTKKAKALNDMADNEDWLDGKLSLLAIARRVDKSKKMARLSEQEIADVKENIAFSAEVIKRSAKKLGRVARSHGKEVASKA